MTPCANSSATRLLYSPPSPSSAPPHSSLLSVSQISCVFSFARVIENHHGLDGEEYTAQYPEYGEGCLLQCDCSAECYRDDSSHREYRSGQGALGCPQWEVAAVGVGAAPCPPLKCMYDLLMLFLGTATLSAGTPRSACDGRSDIGHGVVEGFLFSPQPFPAG